MVRFRIFLQNRDYRLLLPSLCALMLLSGWPGTSAAEPLRRIDQIKAALADAESSGYARFRRPGAAARAAAPPPVGTRLSARPAARDALVQHRVRAGRLQLSADRHRARPGARADDDHPHRDLRLSAAARGRNGLRRFKRCDRWRYPRAGRARLADLQACALDRRRRLARDNAVERCGHACEFRGAHGGRISRPARHADRDPDHGRRTGRLRNFRR